MGRLFDEDDVINALWDLRRNLQLMDNSQRADLILHGVFLAEKRIERLPSAQLDTQWIPCSPETMPKKTGYYLVQYTRKYCRNEMAVAFYSVEEARCDDDYTWEIETFSDIKEVIAWMPLPEPYREEGDE